MAEEDDDRIPTLHDILRPGDGAPASRPEGAPETGPGHYGEADNISLTDAEIEAIAHRVIEQHTEHLRKAIIEAVHAAIDAKNRERQSDGNDGDDDQS